MPYELVAGNSMLSEVSIVLETLYVLLESWGWLCHAGNGFPARTRGPYGVVAVGTPAMG